MHEKKDEKVPTTGGPGKKEPIRGLEFEGQPPVGSKREAELLKAREVIDKELEGIRDARGKEEFEKTPEGKLWQKQWEESQAIKKQQQAEAEKNYQEVLCEARRIFVLDRFADDLLKKEKVNENAPEFAKVLQRVLDIRGVIWSAYRGR